MFIPWQIFGLVTFAIIGFIVTLYGGYYFYVSRFTNKLFSVNKNTFTPNITIVVPTYNEEVTIEKKLDNLYKQTYPPNLVEIIVIDSNSKDGTLKIARGFMNSHKELNMKIIAESERQGKSEAINKAFSCANPQSEILLMTDVDSILKEDAVEKVVSCFANPKIGAVFGRQVLLNESESRETMSEATYKHFFTRLRIGESVIDSTPIFDGELAGYRANAIRGIKVKENLNADDSQLAIIVRKKGYRTICESEAIFYEYAPPDWNSKWVQKVRRSQGLSRMFWYNKDMLFKKEYGKFGRIILPANFFMHVISPFMVLFSIVFGLSFFCSLLFQHGNLTIWAFLGVFIILLLGVSSRVRRLLNVAWAFLEYQTIALMGILLFLFGRSLHRWQKVESIREKFRNETIM